MRRLFAALLLCFGTFAISAGTYHLVDGSVVSGDPISYNETGIAIKDASGIIQPRVAWTNFTQDSLKDLAKDAKTKIDAAYVLSNIEAPKSTKPSKEFAITMPARIPRSHGGTILSSFASPIGLFLLFIFYAANLYAAYEVALFRIRPVKTVCGIAAVAPWIGPIAFLAMKPGVTVGTVEALRAEPPVPVATEGTVNPASPVGALSSASVAPHVPEPISPVPVSKVGVPESQFARPDFTFNKRFIETRLTSFVSPAPEATGSLLLVESPRGRWLGNRISELTPTDMTVQIVEGSANSAETVTFLEVQRLAVFAKGNAPAVS